MANEVKIKKNCYLINAPAGSGKTTTIKKRIQSIISDDENSNILCITFTNRAADELNVDIDSTYVQIHTIHSFIDSFIKIYFNHKKIINLYFEIYKNDIIDRINNEENKEWIDQSNKRYIEQNGQLDFDTVKKNVQHIYYNELPFNSLYLGGLSHDDLLEFAKIVMARYPKINKRVSQKYNYIFIDEYQDTSASILRIFYNAVEQEKTKLYLFGDKMQQIYKNYDGSFEDELNTFDQSEKLTTNYRSTKPIIDVLNNIYNDKDFKQELNEKANKDGKTPLVYLCDNIEKAVENETIKNPNVLNLVVYNKKRFKSAGAENLYTVVNNMDKYRFGRKYNAVDILTTNNMDNPDELFRLLFLWHDMYENYKEEKYGLVIQAIKYNNLNSEILKITKHDEKKQLNSLLNKVFEYFEDKSDSTINEWLIALSNNDFLNNNLYNEIISLEDYQEVLEVTIEEFKNLYYYLSFPTVSTQHGVKGEGYDEVFFVAEDSSNPSIKMYDFFDLWVNQNVVFNEMQSFYYRISNDIKNLEGELEFKVSKLNKKTFEYNQELIDHYVSELYSEYGDNSFFKAIYKELFDEYFAQKKVTKAKECLKINRVYGILSAYKLFYVGCSRAKKELTIFIDTQKIKGDKESLCNKFETVGFDVEEYRG